MTRAALSVKEAEPEKIYYCNVCGYGYANEAVAKECEEYCKTHNSCSLQITAKAIRKPELMNPSALI
jgi:hypothetical protein